jgi:2-succinyl-5-enolpyruvyl-6-hydroxy-3-cyclohexene-1-carboxylate synthase
MAREHDRHGVGHPGGVEGEDEREDIYTHHIATPTGLDFAAAAALYGIAHERVDEVHAFRAALERALGESDSSLIEVRSGRGENVALHRQVFSAVSRALNP